MTSEHFKQKKNVSYKSIKKDQSFKDKKIAIVTLFDHNYSDLAKMSIKNKIEYANKHNYDFIYFFKSFIIYFERNVIQI